MNKQDISVQLYTTRKFEPYPSVLNFIRESGVSNLELFGLESMNIDEFKNMMESNNITSYSTHVGFEALQDTKNIVDRAKELNIKHVIVPAPPAKKDGDFRNTFEMNEAEWIAFGNNLSSYVSQFEDEGLTLGYHNHSYEFIALPSGKFPIECMMDQNENLKFEIDLGWAVAGGADPKTWIQKYSNKIIACHLKDFYSKEKDMLDHGNQSAVGDGFIDWSDLISSVKKTNCELYVLEHDDPKDYKEYISKSVKNLETI
jgi:sugar phosphate isomerase/epimerase